MKFKLFRKKQPIITENPVKCAASTHVINPSYDYSVDNLTARINLENKIFQRTPADFKITAPSHALDSAIAGTKGQYQLNNSLVSLPVLDWFASQGFIGYQACAVMAQHWLIDKACKVPAKEAISRGYEITVNEGLDLDTKIIDDIKKYDVKYKIRKNLIEFIQMCRIFGVRIALFNVDSKDPLYYEKPFNIDGIKKGSYKGISQVDPYWIVPELDEDSSSNPASRYFYEPTWWQINGKRYHRSHLIIARHAEVADILKPSYFYGGISLVQEIYSRVYAAERTADEGPQLALTKRANVMFMNNLTEIVAKQGEFERQMQFFSQMLDNYGTKVLGSGDRFEQHDTSLSDLDNVIMTMYQLVAAVSGVPATKLLGTSPKGFNSTGDNEENNYHEMLKDLQTDFLTPLLERHYLLLVKSEIAPKYELPEFTITPNWNELKILGDVERSQVNKTKAETGELLMAAGVISAQEERERIIGDEKSGYSGLPEELPEVDPTLENELNAFNEEATNLGE